MRWRIIAALLVVTLTAKAQGPSDTTGTDQLRAVLSSDTEKELLAELAAIPVAKKTLQSQVIAKGRRYVKLVRHGVLPLRAGFDSLLAHAARVERLSRSLARDIVTLQELDARKKVAQEQLRDLEIMRRRFDAEMGDLERSREAIAAAREREAAFARVFSSAGRARTAVYSAKASRADAEQSLRTLRGRLPLPVGGRIEVEPVNLEDARGPGLLLTVAPAAEVVAVHRGKVVLVADHSGDTRAVLIDHGDGFTTLSGGLVYLRVRVGDRVEAGDVLGSARRGSGATTVYFELRDGSRNLYAEEWFGL